MKKLVPLLILLVACVDSPVAMKPVGPAHSAVIQRDCRGPGRCRKCMGYFVGKVYIPNCHDRDSDSCPGVARDQVMMAPFEVEYESGGVAFEEKVTQVLARGRCEVPSP